MKEKNNSSDIRRIFFMTEKEYLMHLGENYEAAIQKALEDLEPVIRIINVNGNPSSIPLERALYLLEKYHKLIGKQKAQQKVVPIPSKESKDETLGQEEAQRQLA